MNDVVKNTSDGIVDLIREDREATEALIAKMQADHAAEVERLKQDVAYEIASCSAVEQRLRNELEHVRHSLADLIGEGVNLNAEVARLTAERDAAVARAGMEESTVTRLREKLRDKCEQLSYHSLACANCNMSDQLRGMLGAEVDFERKRAERAEAFIKALSEESLDAVDKQLATEFLAAQDANTREGN